MAQEGWILFPHGADIGVRGIGLTRGQAFAEAAHAAGLARKVATLVPVIWIQG